MEDIFLFYRCCESQMPQPGTKDACCHIEGFAAKEAEWICNRKIYSKQGTNPNETL